MKHPFALLVGSILLCLFLTSGGFFAFFQYKKKKIEDEKYYIKAIVQTGPEKEALKTGYLAELLDLSIDRPVSLYAFDCKEAEKKLLFCPLIKSAKVKRMRPNAIYVDYEIRKPIAMLADYKNTAIDWEGYIFPFTPFFSPKEIPEIYLGLPPFEALNENRTKENGQWLTPIKNPFLTLAFEVLKFLEEAAWREHFRLKKIDVSNAFATSLGQREIVLFTEEKLVIRREGKEVFCIFPKILRVAPKDFAQELGCFCTLRRNMEKDYREQLASFPNAIEEMSETMNSLPVRRFSSRIIDLRIPQLAFVQTREYPP
jgi:hypothetical protein